MYFTFLELPPWFRSRRNGWIPFSYVLHRDQKQVSLTDSMLVKYMLCIFDSDDSNLAFGKGFGVHGGDGSIQKVRAKAFLCVADWDQHAKTFTLKGPNGSVPCWCCRNVLGHCVWFVDPYLVHVHSHEHERFHNHTTESVNEIMERLQAIAANGTNAALKREEQATGFKYDPDGLMFDAVARRKMNPPRGIYPDWMHGWVASGGLAAYECNGLCLFMQSRDVSPEDIDDWVANVKLPSGVSRLSRHFFRNRVVQVVGKPMRAFAGEMLTVVMLLGFFLDVFPAPAGDQEWADRRECFILLRIILVILQRGNIGDLPTLRSACRSHSELYKRFYHCIPKLHEVAHVADYWWWWKALLSCFGPERHHKLMKRVMGFAYKNAGKTALAYDIRTWFKNLDLEELYMPTHLSGKKKIGHGATSQPFLAA